MAKSRTGLITLLSLKLTMAIFMALVECTWKGGVVEACWLITNGWLNRVKRDYGTNECGMRNRECGMGRRRKSEFIPFPIPYSPFPIPHSAFRIRLFRNLSSFHQLRLIQKLRHVQL